MGVLTNNRGMSLFEILIVIAILLALIITSYLAIPPQINKAFDARRKADLHLIKTNLEIFYSFAEEFPRELPDCGQPLAYQSEIILKKIPCDPVTKESYFYQTHTGQPQSYRLYANLTNTNDFSITDVGCLGGCGPDCSYNYGVSSMNINLIRCSYVCAPGGYCELFQDSSKSTCPKFYYKDPNCNNECNKRNKSVWCHDSSGKNIPY